MVGANAVFDSPPPPFNSGEGGRTSVEPVLVNGVVVGRAHAMLQAWAPRTTRDGRWE